MVCPTVRLREGIARHPDSRYLVIAERRRQVLAGLARRPRATVVQTSLPPVARSARAARDLVARTLLDWGCGPQIGGATLVVSELVTHAMQYADSDLLVTVARCGAQVRISVAMRNRTNAQLMGGVDPARISHRGLMLVAAVSESWGVLPTSDGGKVVWAVLAANPPSARTRLGGGRTAATARPRRPSQAGRGPRRGRCGLRPRCDTMAAPTSSQLVRVLASAEWMRARTASDLLSTAERQRAQRFRREEDRLDFIAAHLLARQVVAELLGVDVSGGVR